jgi:prepilin-type N-terminal cleavage/methylation domain-containing protein
MLTKKNISGFTLVEMAMVLAIIALLLGGLLPTLSTQMESQRINATNRHLDEIRQALIGFAIANGRLPCPADPAIAAGQANAGVEAVTGTACSNVANNAATGVLPWATLGVDETDAWGNRYTYRATAIFADAIGTNTFGGSCPGGTAATQSSFALCTNGNLDVLSAASSTTKVAIDVPAVVISHGKNGAGAYTRQGSQLPAGGDTDEQENSDGGSDNNYVSHTPTPGFDDQIMWLSGNILLNRMVAAGKLP